uniref:Uncharacterized protein n=1 Tax=Timema poppense TaxID=170557 RepID=A0A7R9HCZ9_TIMPO|nr:unnamed protein product [Timema poppensis]
MARADYVRYKRHGGIQQATAHARSEERNGGGGHDPLALLLNPSGLDTMGLLEVKITSKDRSQWKVVLEQNASSYYWSVDESKQSVSTQEVTFIANNSIGELEPLTSYNSIGELEHSNNNIDVELMSRRSSHLPTARSRLQGLKQLSVEKLASLRHKLAETRSKGIVASISDSSHSKQGE